MSRTFRSRVTTGQGDDGHSRSLSGFVVPKHHALMDATGWVDTLRAHTAEARLMLIAERPALWERLDQELFWLLHCYFLVGAAVSDPHDKHPEYRPAEIGAEHLARLEAVQAELEAGLELPRAFIVSATTPLAAKLDTTATYARTLERALSALREAEPAFRAEHILRFINRLSDFLYVLARHCEGGQHLPVDYGVLQSE